MKNRYLSEDFRALHNEHNQPIETYGSEHKDDYQYISGPNHQHLIPEPLKISTPSSYVSHSYDKSTEDAEKLNTSSETVDNPENVPKKHTCSCDRTKCLKLYCDCFKSGVMCSGCNCKSCFNNEEHEEERNNAIDIILMKNKNAFDFKTCGIAKAKIVQSQRGCRCSKSNCLKRYCECYQNKIFCGKNCRCVDCHNSHEYRTRSLIQDGHGLFLSGDYKYLLGNHLNHSGVGMQRTFAIPIQPNYPAEHHQLIRETHPLIDMANAAMAHLSGFDQKDAKTLIAENLEEILNRVYRIFVDVIKTPNVDCPPHEVDMMISQILENFRWCLTDMLNQ